MKYSNGKCIHVWRICLACFQSSPRAPWLVEVVGLPCNDYRLLNRNPILIYDVRNPSLHQVEVWNKSTKSKSDCDCINIFSIIGHLQKTPQKRSQGWPLGESQRHLGYRPQGLHSCWSKGCLSSRHRQPYLRRKKCKLPSLRFQGSWLDGLTHQTPKSSASLFPDSRVTSHWNHDPKNFSSINFC